MCKKNRFVFRNIFKSLKDTKKYMYLKNNSVAHYLKMRRVRWADGMAGCTVQP